MAGLVSDWFALGSSSRALPFKMHVWNVVLLSACALGKSVIADIMACLFYVRLRTRQFPAIQDGRFAVHPCNQKNVRRRTSFSVTVANTGLYLNNRGTSATVLNETTT